MDDVGFTMDRVQRKFGHSFFSFFYNLVMVRHGTVVSCGCWKSQNLQIPSGVIISVAGKSPN